MIGGIFFRSRRTGITSSVILALGYKPKVAGQHIAPGKPTQNSFIESPS